MKLTLLQEDLSKGLAITSRFASPKAQLPILGNVLFRVSKNKLNLLSTNLETSICLTIGAKVTKEGKITVPSRIVSDIISNFPKGQIEIEAANEKMKLTSDGYSTNIVGMEASDFPVVPTTLGKELLNVSSSKIVNGLADVLFAASVDETRPVLTGVLFQFRGKKLLLVATDGFRLSKKEIDIPEVKKEIDLILPKSALAEVVRLSNLNDTISISFEEGDSQIIFGVGDVVFSSRVIQGEFPNFKKIIPDKSEIKVNIDKEELQRAVKVASVFARDAANSLTFKISDGDIIVTAKSASGGSQKASVDAKVEGVGKNGLEIAFNFKFVEEFISTVKGNSIIMKFNGPNSPGVFLDPTVDTYLHLIMPVKL